MEDSDDKIRRNLVAASAIILLLAWLDMPLPAVADRLLGANFHEGGFKLQPYRVWWAALALLVYFSLHYRFSSDVIAGARMLSTAAQFTRFWLVERLLRAHLRRFNDSGHDSPLFPVKLSTWERSQTKEMQTGIPEPEPPLGRAKLALGSLSKEGEFKGSMRVTYQWQHQTRGRLETSGTVIQYEINGWRRMTIDMYSYGKALIYSQGSLELVVPVVLAVIAVGTVIWKLWVTTQGSASCM